MLIDFFFDFETRSRSDLKKNGSVRYATDPSTEATLLTWTFGRCAPIKAWRKGHQIPAEIVDVAQNPHKYHFIAHNVAFDYLIWTQVFSKHFYNFKAPKIENLSDNMAHTSHFRVGAGLDTAATVLKLPYSKDKEGRRLMLKQCKPNSKTGEWVELTPEEWDKFELYGIIDTRLLRDIYYMIPPLPSPERYAWEWTFKRNLRGIKLDMDLVNEMNDIIQTSTPGYVKEFEYLTGYKAKINSPVTCKEFFKQYYPHIENMQADTLRDMLADKRYVPPHVRRALEIKDLAAGASLAKVSASLRQNYNGRIYGNLAYAHAQTKRWAGRGIQVHNFPRVDEKRPDALDFELNVQDLTSSVRAKRPHLRDPLGFTKNLLRRIFLPDSPDLTFYCGDWSKIEPTVLFWLTGLGTIPHDVYEEMAAEIYSVPKTTIGKESEERQLGKGAFLGGGYSMGHKKFKVDILKKYGLEISEALSKQTINAYRKKYNKIVELWHQLEWGFKQAVQGQSAQLCDGKIFISPMLLPHKGVQIRLPSGSILYYHHARITPPEDIPVLDDEGNPTYDEKGRQIFEHEKASLAYISADNGYLKKLYGGLLTEHVTSCTARDIILPAVYNLEAAGFDILNTVHDELWGQGAPGRDKEFERIMCINPSWCPDMNISAGCKNGVRYLK